MREASTNKFGRPFDISEQRTVWQKGKVVVGYDPNVWRQDRYGNHMKFSEYGNRNSQYGWEIDYIKPVSAGGTDDLANLQPLYWRENAEKSNIYPYKNNHE